MFFMDGVYWLHDSRLLEALKFNNVNCQARVALPMRFQGQVAGQYFSGREGYVAM